MTTFGKGMQIHSKDVQSTTRQMDFDEKDVDFDKIIIYVKKDHKSNHKGAQDSAHKQGQIMHPSVPHEFYAYCETCLAY
jgi:hypothetical protein